MRYGGGESHNHYMRAPDSKRSAVKPSVIIHIAKIKTQKVINENHILFGMQMTGQEQSGNKWRREIRPVQMSLSPLASKRWKRYPR